MVAKVRERYGEPQLSHFTRSIRTTVSGRKKIAKAVAKEIIHALEHGRAGDWGWSIGVLLASGDDGIKKQLKKSLLDDEKFAPKTVINLLRDTKILPEDEEYLFRIEETETEKIPGVSGSKNEISMVVYYRDKEILRNSVNYGRTISRETAVGSIRRKIVHRIVKHFCG